MATGNETSVPPFIPSSNVMNNGYFGGVTMETANLNCVHDQREEIVSLRRSVDLGYMTSTTIDNDDVKNKYKETDVVLLREKKPKYKDMSAQMKEYNVNYCGLVIIPWEEFAENPRKLNDLFYLEKNGQITYDPDEVNVFFHATKMNKPTFGDISETGKSWVVNIESIKDLEQVRVWLIERASVFGVTLVKKTSRFGRSDRAPCLVMFDPTMGHSDAIHASIMRCINVMQDGKKFCLQIDLNGCVERWCRRITMTKCKAVGAKLIITNGEEPANLTDAENIFCCIVCFPIWSIQAGVYKIHRHAQYKDFELKFDAEELVLYGTLGGVRNQRAKLFKDYQTEIFRTKPIEEAGPEFQGPSIDRHKERKTMRQGKNKSDEYSYVEDETSSINGVSLKENGRFNEVVHRTKNPNNLSDTNVVINYYDKGKQDIHGDDVNEQKTKQPYRIGDSDKVSNNKIELGLELRENTNSSDSSGITRDCKDEGKIKSFLEVESCTMRKELSPIQSARTVNSEIMIITQSNDEETPDGNGSEIDLRTFLKTEFNPPPEKPKKKSRKHKRNSKPPKPPSKKSVKGEHKGVDNDKGVDNGAFDNESENKFRRMLPSKRRSLESIDTIDTLESNHKPQTESSATCSRDSLDTPLDAPEFDSPTSDNEESTNRPSDNTVLSLKSDNEDETLAGDNDENDNNSVHQVFQLNIKFQQHKKETHNDSNSESEDDNVIRHDGMSCDDLEFSDLDADDEENPQKEEIETNKSSSIRNTTTKKQTIRGSAPYRSNRQKYIGMNTSFKNGRLPSLKNK